MNSDEERPNKKPKLEKSSSGEASAGEDNVSQDLFANDEEESPPMEAQQIPNNANIG